LIPIRGWVVNFNSHSQYIDLIAQVGILGLFCFLWIFFEVLKLSWRLLKNKSLTGFAESYTFGVFAGAIATLVAAFLGDWVLPFVYNVGLNGFRASILTWIFIGGLVVIEKISTENGSLL
jgi:O-antigen ligase